MKSFSFAFQFSHINDDFPKKKERNKERKRNFPFCSGLSCELKYFPKQEEEFFLVETGNSIKTQLPHIQHRQRME
jgi:hypothetical protein